MHLPIYSITVNEKNKKNQANCILQSSSFNIYMLIITKLINHIHTVNDVCKCLDRFSVKNSLSFISLINFYLYQDRNIVI